MLTLNAKITRNVFRLKIGVIIVVARKILSVQKSVASINVSRIILGT